MSKATRFARRATREMRFRERLSAFQRKRKMEPLVAIVGRRGMLIFGDDEGNVGTDRLRPKEAIRFARWILDTFGEGS